MLTVHFGAGNIGRGFIGEVLNQNGSKVAFVDVNSEIIDALNKEESYTIELAQENKETVLVDNVYGINNGDHPQQVVGAIAEADLITTAIGPKILPYIAPLIAQGIAARQKSGVETALDVIACENMIGGSTFLKDEVLKHIENEETVAYVESHIGFPDAAVDRIVPLQSHEDVLKVTVEPYKEWVVSTTGLKNKDIRLEGVKYVEDLQPYIERKLFTVNTGHATTAYHGKYAGYSMIDEALRDNDVYNNVQATLSETGALMVEKWGFNEEEHASYIKKILSRFENPELSDDISRVGRTPIRKLGYDERLVRPLREANDRNLSTDALIETIGKALHYDETTDEESIELQQLLKEKSLKEVVTQVTGLSDEQLVDKIVEKYTNLT